jgi:glycogen phosphorylase
MTDPAVVQLPAALAELQPLAYNLRWSWDLPTRALFERIDPELWRRTGGNPVRLLAEADPGRLESLAADRAFRRELAARSQELTSYLASRSTWYLRRHEARERRLVAYFSAEFGVAACLRIFSGGLGVLAGDHLKSASDLGVPLCGVGLFYGLGYFTQQIDGEGRQRDAYVAADPRQLPLRPVLNGRGEPLLVAVPLGERQAHARIWRADVGRVPLFLLDTNVPENTPDDRQITDRLYGGDNEHRLKQEIVLGIGGMRALKAMGEAPAVIHLNEGHAAFAAVERARELMTSRSTFREATTRAAKGVVFTTHTPVAAGHDYFAPALLERYLRGYVWELREPWDRFLGLGRTAHDSRFCMTALAIRSASIRNGVSRLHGVVSRTMWHDLWPELAVDDVPISHITNGVHLPSWVGPEVARLYHDRIGADWHADADEMHWHRAGHIPLDELWAARAAQRHAMVAQLRRHLAAEARRRGEDAGWTSDALDADALTIVFARRFATYKRATLLLSQPERLMKLLRDRERPVQFVFAGKAHPRDEPGQALLQQIVRFARMPEFRDRFLFLEGYDLELASHLVRGADVWLNVPLRPYEASGTSGMKAAANGGLNLSIPDGWWAEAWEEHNRLPEPIGWCVAAGEHAAALELDGPEAGRAERDRADAEELYRLLEQEVVPLFHEQRQGAGTGWAERARSAMRQCGGYFNTHRMVREYVESVYLPAATATERLVGAAHLASGA